ncbi:3-ketoacyl-reductase [Niveomyces insectorum RCEF 264]|uniref:Very-long-chain 3-oxoacyl-CoA reductase n=1 Tax=Niveomyces insectorum RCEF 264 TaxID=1081102 RepID=A0A167YMV7_9HYPO|nr:3-ketoacyl-reductase [Niveomyces insectorum RCEF 264]
MESLKEILAAVPRPAQAALAAVGALYVGSKLFSFLGLLLSLTVLTGTNLRKYGKKGTWAVVTGASDGLGKEYASQLAAKGFNLVLVSRTKSKLDALASQLEDKYAGSGLQTKVLAMDYAQNDDADYERLAELIDGLDIGILVNSVGQSHSIPVPFLQTAGSELQNIVTINCLGTLKTTQVVAPGMVQRKRGLILTMGSFGGWMPTPYLATYSGSKAFLQQWSSSVAAELKPSGIDTYLVLSYLVVSAMSKVRRPSLLIPRPDAFVRTALGKVGVGRQAFAYTYTPYWSHAIFQWVVESTLGVGHSLSIWYNLVMHKDIRNRALRKAAREAKKA